MPIRRDEEVEMSHYGSELVKKFLDLSMGIGTPSTVEGNLLPTSCIAFIVNNGITAAAQSRVGLVSSTK